MKEALNHLSLDCTEIHAQDIDCETDSCSDSPTAADQDLMARPDSSLQPNPKSSQYQLQLPISNRSVPDHVFPHSIWMYTGTPRKTEQVTGQDQHHYWTTKTWLTNG